MADPQTTNILLAIPGRGTDAGAWDTPLNANTSALDGYLGGVQGIAVAAAPHTLSAPDGPVMPAHGPTEAQNAVLRFSGMLTADVTVTLPLPGYYIIDTLVGLVPTSFVIILRAAGVGEVVGLQYGNVFHVYCDGTNVFLANLPAVGSYLDLAVPFVMGADPTPRWILACTRPPWINCIGQATPANCPVLKSMFGATLPDFRGVSPAYLNQGQDRINTTRSTIDGNTLFSTGGADVVGLTPMQLPLITSGVTITALSAAVSGTASDVLVTSGGGGNGAATGMGFTGGQGTVSGTATVDAANRVGSGSGVASSNNTAQLPNGAGHLNMQPTTIAGIRLIRAG
jgi:hypothetical protein